MIINIPLTIDDELWASALARDYESKVTEKLTNEVRKAIMDQDSRYYMREKSFNAGLENWVSYKIDDILKEHKDEIIDAAAEKLAERQKVDYSKLYVSMFWEMPNIKNVIFNDPATIVFWADGTKTVVQCQDDDIFDPEKGLAMAITKKALGNKGNYCNELKKWLPKDEEVTLKTVLTLSPSSVIEAMTNAIDKMSKFPRI